MPKTYAIKGPRGKLHAETVASGPQKCAKLFLQNYCGNPNPEASLKNLNLVLSWGFVPIEVQIVECPKRDVQQPA